MKKISEEEFNGLESGGMGNSSKFYKAIISLRVGERLFIGREEYTLSRGPGRICRTIMKRFPNVKYEFARLADESGWKVKRVE